MKLLFTRCVAIAQITGYTLRMQIAPFYILAFYFSVQGTEDNFGCLPRALICNVQSHFNLVPQFPPLPGNLLWYIIQLSRIYQWTVTSNTEEIKSI